jgi:hypothetical protein
LEVGDIFVGEMGEPSLSEQVIADRQPLTPNLRTNSRSGGSMSPGLSSERMRVWSCSATLVKTRFRGIISTLGLDGTLAVTGFGPMTDL